MNQTEPVETDMARTMKKGLPVVVIHKAINVEFDGGESKKNYPKDSVAIMPLHGLPADDLQRLVDNGYISIYPADDFFTRWTVKDRSRYLFSHLGGGIGDMFAFSSMTYFLENPNLNIYVDSTFIPVFEWFEVKPIVNRFDEIIMGNYTPQNRLGKYKMIRRIAMEYFAIQGREQNWFEAMYGRIGAIPTADLLRPRLISHRLNNDNSYIRNSKSVLIQHRASCQMRSSRFVDFFYPISNVYKDCDIYVHESDLTEEDKDVIHKMCLNVIVIPKCSLATYLLNLYDVGDVISVDTGAIHFREGIGKRCLGVYGAMTTESRTSGYIYTKSFNVSSECPFQPCYIHELMKGQKCKNHSEGELTAKCQSGVKFQEQLLNELIKYK